MNIFVGGGSRDSEEKCHYCAAEALGEYIAQKHHDFVFGGCSSGVIGATYREVIKNFGSKIYVSLLESDRDVLKTIKNNVAYMASTANERIDWMLRYADVAVFLPGGDDTLSEILSAIVAVKNQQFKGKVILLNIGGFYDMLLRQLGLAKWYGFSEDIREYCYVFNTVSEAIALLDSPT